MGHLGARVSALLDGQLSRAEADEAWAHVYACHACRDLVEREGWVKTRLAGLCEGGASPDLKGSLLSLTPGEQFLAEARHGGGVRRGVSVAVIGGGTLGAAMVGVLALGFGPGPAGVDRRPPVSRVETPAVSETDAEAPSTGDRQAPVRATHVVVAERAGTASVPVLAAAVLPDWVAHLLP
ncbi:hypothetical protein [Nocardioides stalactiti]|uniref:hypothetical protein n=1 Tax=Nocardioides stalactiti TaxID=2755356 RepID=UPI0016030E4C|nr:hypothetical protein [Nocardioides stalactiti]